MEAVKESVVATGSESGTHTLGPEARRVSVTSGTLRGPPPRARRSSASLTLAYWLLIWRADMEISGSRSLRLVRNIGEYDMLAQAVIDLASKDLQMNW